MLFFSVSRCVETLCQKDIQLLVQVMFACSRVRDSESREKGIRYCCEGAEKDQTWLVGVCTGSRSVVK